jgi:ribosomal protein L29
MKKTKINNEEKINKVGEKVRELKIEIAKLRLEMVSGQLKNTSVLKQKRKEIARILTAQKERL